MHYPRILLQFLAALALVTSFTTPALAQQGRGPSTAEEHARVVQLAAKSDKDPIATMSSADGRWFEKWADEVPDYNFGPDAGAFWLMTGAAKGDVMRIARFHHGISTAAYQVQHHITDPMRNPADLAAITLAGVEGMLRAYETLLAARPDNRSAQMDEALAMRNKGMLAEFVKALPPVPKR